MLKMTKKKKCKWCKKLSQINYLLSYFLTFSRTNLALRVPHRQYLATIFNTVKQGHK